MRSIPAADGAMVPDVLPDVLPTDRLYRSGKPKPGVVPGLRDLPGRRNAVAVAALWLQIVAGWTLLRWYGHPLVWALVVLWVGRCLALLFLLNHEAAHGLLFGRRRVNDAVGRVLLAWPALVDFDGYRAAHLTHHRDELGPDEPDMGLYVGYPCRPAKLVRRLARDASGRSAFKQLRALVRRNRPMAARVAAAQVVVASVAFVATGRWWAVIVVWWLPWATVWQVLNRLRAIAEHAGMAPGPDRRRNSHVVRQHWLPAQVLVPFHSGYHLAHHVDTSVPWVRLPALHAELERAGWITPALTHTGYLALWRHLTTVRPTS